LRAFVFVDAGVEGPEWEEYGERLLYWESFAVSHPMRRLNEAFEPLHTHRFNASPILRPDFV